MSEISIKKEVEEGMELYFFRASAADFKKIPGSPIAYWVSDNLRKVFEINPSMKSVIDARQGLATADNNRFLRLWWEPSLFNEIFNSCSVEQSKNSNKKWFPYNKGGAFRKWYGNHEYMVDWENNGEKLEQFKPKAVIRNPRYYFRESVSWSDVTSSSNAFRKYPLGFIFDSTGHSAFSTHEITNEQVLSLCNNKFTNRIIKVLNPTMHFHVGYFDSLPASFITKEQAQKIVPTLISNSIVDWNSYETSWDFTNLPLLHPNCREPFLNSSYQKLRTNWQETTLETQHLEEENNRIFIEAYGLQDELTPEVPLKEITLTCNPHYRYNGNKSDEELEALLLADTMKEFISYAVGCMFGRYSLDKPGLILANQGETIEDYLKQIPEPTFMADDDNVIPLIDFDGDWFEDDISERFKQFLRVSFGSEQYADNLRYIEQAIGKDIRKYFLKNFYSDHVKRYKKRPIYWLISSPKGSFNALIYLHRYRPDTISVVLNDYLREFRTKLTARLDNLNQISISASAEQKVKTRALKDIEKIKKVLDEIDEYEHDVLYPLATQQIEIDLDDGVKVNYPKFGKALKKVAGLS